MNIQDMRQLSDEALQAELQSNYREWFNLRMQAGSGQKPKTHLFKQTRRRIAQLKTIFHERTLNDQVGRL